MADEHHASASVEITAPPEVVYALITDVGRMGEWSPEATGASSVKGSLQVGDTFRGHNKRGLIRWYTHCTVREAQPGRKFVFDVDSGPMPVSRWTYTFEPTATGCRLTETWDDRRFGPLGPVIRTVGSVIIPGPRAAHNQQNIEITLQRLKAAAES